MPDFNYSTLLFKIEDNPQNLLSSKLNSQNVGDIKLYIYKIQSTPPYLIFLMISLATPILSIVISYNFKK